LSSCVEQCCENAADNINMKQYSFGWSNELKQLKQQSIDIHMVWKQIGRPRAGSINEERLRVKALYKKCVHELKQHNAYRKREWLAYKLTAGDSKGFWKGWKQLIKGDNIKNEYNISGVTDEREICDEIKHVFQNSFCDSWSNGWATDKVTRIMSDIKQEFISNECSVFTLDEVVSAISSLKAGKSAGIDGIKSEAIKFAHPIIADVLQCLFNLCCKHGYVPFTFCLGKIVPVPKKPNVCGSFSDFRPITIVTVIAKVFEYCLTNRLSEYVKIHDLQFGFTKGGGCDRALLMFKSVVEYYNEHGSTVFAAALDLTKAYDRLNHCVLILKLYEMGIPRDLVMLFIYWFKNLCGILYGGIVNL
jgi:hypothetical protein